MDFTAVMRQVEVFWAVTSCSVVVGYHRFGGPCCLHLQVRYHNTTPRRNPEELDQKLWTFTFVANDVQCASWTRRSSHTRSILQFLPHPTENICSLGLNCLPGSSLTYCRFLVSTSLVLRRSIGKKQRSEVRRSSWPGFELLYQSTILENFHLNTHEQFLGMMELYVLPEIKDSRAKLSNR
jgi:hypothetical protein